VHQSPAVPDEPARGAQRTRQGFKAALRAALREDPDIVLVGEMRDLETTHIAIETAETGHLVFGTLHTTTAISTVDRLIDQFPSSQQAQIRTMLSAALKGVVAQNLLKKKGGGRIAALEILVVNQAVASLVRDGKTSQIMSIMQTAKKEGNTLLNEELVRLVKEDIVAPEDCYYKAVDKGDLLKGLEAIGVKYTPNFDEA
jgi:twitching motility protein PilT